MVKILIRLVFIASILLMLNGCRWIQTVYVPHGQAVRLRETVKRVKVWVRTETGEIVPGKMDLPEGWYCLPKDIEE